METRVTATRRLQFCAGHRVMGHESKCRHLHGHNYVVYLQAVADEGGSSVDDIGRVIDFSVLKDRFGKWIEEAWDHGFILHESDNAAYAGMHAFGAKESLRQKVFLLPYNPTAENIARYLLLDIGPVLLRDTGVRLSRVTVYETENCIAEVRA